MLAKGNSWGGGDVIQWGECRLHGGPNMRIVMLNMLRLLFVVSLASQTANTVVMSLSRVSWITSYQAC